MRERTGETSAETGESLVRRVTNYILQVQRHCPCRLFPLLCKHAVADGKKRPWTSRLQMLKIAVEQLSIPYPYITPCPYIESILRAYWDNGEENGNRV